MNAVPFIRDVIVVSLLFLLLFAILCTNFFKGTFYSCNLESIGKDFSTALVEHVVDKFTCLDYGGEWVNQLSNFDNVKNSMITLFNIMTTEGWIDVMWIAVDSTKIDRIPEKDSKPVSVIFFIIIIFFFHLFILNMFVGIVINVFAQEK